MRVLNDPVLHLPGSFRCSAAFAWTALILLLTGGVSAQTGAEGAPYARVNSFGILAAYSNDSSHMLLGSAEKRKLLSFGVSYGRRLLLNRVVSWQYDGELLPVALESDPLSRVVVHETSPAVATITENSEGPIVICTPETAPYSFSSSDGSTDSGTVAIFCHGRRWTMGEAMSPVGFRWNFRPRSTLQPFLAGHGGYLYSTQPIPVEAAGSFNFTFDLGAGIEMYRTHARSIRIEYRYHHISNHGTADVNPGIDNGLLQVSYVFGR